MFNPSPKTRLIVFSSVAVVIGFLTGAFSSPFFSVIQTVQ